MLQKKSNVVTTSMIQTSQGERRLVVSDTRGSDGRSSDVCAIIYNACMSEGGSLSACCYYWAIYLERFEERKSIPSAHVSAIWPSKRRCNLWQGLEWLQPVQQPMFRFLSSRQQVASFCGCAPAIVPWFSPRCRA